MALTAAEEWRALAQQCRARRTDLGLSQQAVADAAGMTRVAYATFEGGRRCLYAQELPGLARVLRVSVDELLGIPIELDDELAVAVIGLSKEQLELLATVAEVLLSRRRAGAHSAG